MKSHLRQLGYQNLAKPYVRGQNVDDLLPKQEHECLSEVTYQYLI